MAEASDAAASFPEPPHGLLIAPDGSVVAQLDDPEEVAAAVEELVEAGFDREGMWVLCGSQGAERLDVTGRDHGLKGLVYRFVERIGDEREVLLQLEEHLSSGGPALTVSADEEARSTAARILGGHGAHDMAHFGKGHWGPLGS